MKPCKVVGLENVTWKCNWNCTHCFFRRAKDLHTNKDTSLDRLKREINAGKSRGCNSVVLCGKGEPMMHSRIDEIIAYISGIGMKSLIITNGSMGIGKYQRLYKLGLDHLHISMHGLGETLDKISERKGAGRKQMELLEWLNKESNPFRINITLQQLNHQEVFNIAEKAVQFGAFHVSLLNFLPHYHWKSRTKEVAVNPIELINILEKSMKHMEGKVIFTLRYFPMCLLKPDYWKYVTNTRFVLFDPWEWDYGCYSEDVEKVWRAAIIMGRVVAIKGEPCDSCLLKEHCGGWNRFYAHAFNFEGLKAIKEIPDELKEAVDQKGGLFDLNPANLSGGHVR